MKLHKIQEALEILGVWSAIERAAKSGGTITSGVASSVINFIGLTDTPGSYEGQSGNFLKVKDTEDGLEFDGIDVSLEWGEIEGSIEDQADLQSALDDIITVDTRDNILAISSPSSGDIAYSTDTERFYVYDGSDWQESAVQFSVRENKDMGYETNSSLQGYGEDYVTDKQLSNVLIGGNARTENGGIRVDVTKDPDTLEVYLRDAWQTIIYDLTVENDDFRHTPLSEQIYVWSGSSVKKGLNGRPMVNEYEVSMGCMPVPRIIDCGAF